MLSQDARRGPHAHTTRQVLAERALLNLRARSRGIKCSPRAVRFGRERLLSLRLVTAEWAALRAGSLSHWRRHAPCFPSHSSAFTYGGALAGMTTIGGVVKNISKQELAGISVVLELRRRKDGGLEESVLPVTPAQLQPEQEGSYSVTLPAQNVASIRLVGLKVEPQSTLIAYSSSQGKKRTPERLEPRTVVVKRSGKPGEFINSPDNPGRVP